MVLGLVVFCVILEGDEEDDEYNMALLADTQDLFLDISVLRCSSSVRDVPSPRTPDIGL